MSCPAFLNMKTLMVSMVESPFSFNHISNIKILNAVHCSISLSQRVEYQLQFKGMEDLLLCDPVGVLISSYANLRCGIFFCAYSVGFKFVFCIYNEEPIIEQSSIC